MSEAEKEAPVAELATVEPVEVVPSTSLYPAEASPWQVLRLAADEANALASVIEDQKLFAIIKGRKHVTVEGWNTLGGMKGVYAVVQWTRRTDDFQAHRQTTTWKSVTDEQGRTKKVKTVEVERPGAGAWEARAEARLLDGRVVGAVEAECSYDEETWRTRDSHALRSMAQTRAQAKALRMALSYVVKLAGFDPTPEEEMPYGGAGIPNVPMHSLPTEAGDHPEVWAKMVVLALTGGDKAKAGEWWTMAIEDHPPKDVEAVTKAEAEGLVEAAHAHAQLVASSAGYGEHPY